MCCNDLVYTRLDLDDNNDSVQLSIPLTKLATETNFVLLFAMNFPFILRFPAGQ